MKDFKKFKETNEDLIVELDLDDETILRAFNGELKLDEYILKRNFKSLEDED